jgi:glyoxylase-like metal-dependent hydrolase (beta-lactamase superfamily II)
MELMPIHPGIFLVPGVNDGHFPFSHSVLIDSDVVCLIDAGCGLAVLEQVQEIATPDLILASHAHPDHISGCWMFEDVPIHAPIMSAASFGDLDAMAKRFAPPHLERTYKSFIQGSMGFESCPATDTYDAGKSFDFGQARLVAIHAPGHTDDHMCFFDTATGILIAGDIDLRTFGPWYGDRESDIGQMRDAVQNLMDLEPRLVVSSHEGVIRTDIQERFQRYLEVITMRHGAIAELVRRERSLDELVDLSPIYGGHSHAPALTRYWEGQMIEKHLDLLTLENRVQRTRRGYVAKR